MLQRALAVRIGLRCSAWLWLRFSIMWLAGNSASLPCTRDAWNMDHGSSEAVRPHDFGRSVVSLCLSVFMRSRRAATERKREDPWRGRIGVWQKSRILVGLGFWLECDCGSQKPPTMSTITLARFLWCKGGTKKSGLNVNVKLDPLGHRYTTCHK